MGLATHQTGLVLGGAAYLFLWVSATCAEIINLNWRLVGVALLMPTTFFHFSSFLLCYTEGTECHWFYASNFLLIAALFLICQPWGQNSLEQPGSKLAFKDTSIRKLTSSSHPVNFDDANGIHSLTSGNSHTLNSNKSFRPNNRQRSQREIIV